MSKFIIGDLIKEAAEAYEAGNYLKSKNIYQELYGLYKREIGEKHPYTLEVLENLARSYVRLGVYNKALELHEELYVTRKEVLGKKHPDTLSALNGLACSYFYSGDYNKVLELQNKLYNARKEILGESHPDTLNALSNLSVFYSYLGYYDKAFELQDTVYTAQKEILGENHPDTLTTLYNLAKSYSDLGDYDKALETKSIVYSARKEILGENHPDTLNALNNLVNSYSDLGDYNKAVELQNIVYNAQKEILGENHPDTLNALSNLANYYSDLGDYNKALELQNTVYTAQKEILGENHPDTLNTLDNLSNSYSDLGDYDKALELQNTVYDAQKEILGENHPDTLFTLNNLVNSYSDLGNYNKAVELQNTVYNALKEILGENHPDTLSALNNLAASYSNLGDYNKALELQKTVYNFRKEILGEDHPDTLLTLENLGNTYNDLGNYSKALELQCEVYNALKEIIGMNYPVTLTALANLASTYSYLEDYNKALEIENIAYNALKENLGETHPDTLAALSGIISIQTNKDEIDNQSIKNHLTAYFENINNLKTTAFSIEEVSSRRHFLELFNNVYEILKSCVFKRNIKDLLDYLFVNKNLSFEMDVNRFHNKNMGERLFLKEISNMIGNQLIIDFYELDNLKYGLILIKKGKYSQCVVDYEEIISGTFVNDEDIQLFIGSIRDYDHIYICPDGKLYNLSFERVLNCLNISYLSSVQTLFDNDTDDGNTDQLVSFVYPDFSGTQSEDNDRGDTKGVLYGSYLEGMFIHDIYGERSTIYSSYQANHDNFFNTKRPRVLHVSTHGDYLDNEHMEPMDRGILCLSGYNVEDNNFGYISAKEIQYMDLKGTELVVLSACNTGLGENISGEGIYGIRRAFELAGCQTLLLTVEEVDDYNSAIFMKSFYERYNQTNNVYQSFKDTKEYLKKYGLVELKELRDVFEKEMKNKIKNPFVYTRNFNELNKRIEESEPIGQIVRKKNNQYIQEDWNGFIIQGKIEN